jgi:hypothetical protein
MNISNEELSALAECSVSVVKMAISRKALDATDAREVFDWVINKLAAKHGLRLVSKLAPNEVEAEPEDKEPTDQEYMDELGYVPVKEVGKTKTQEILDECFGDMETTLDQSVDGYTYVPKPSPDPALPLKADTAEEVGKILENKKQKGFEW